MSRPEIEAIRKRAEQASEGPWVGFPTEDIAGASVYDSHWLIATIRIADDEEQTDANVRFIAHARTDVPYLLARIDALEKHLRAAVGRCGTFDIIEGAIPCRARDDKCSACRAALALLDGSGE